MDVKDYFSGHSQVYAAFRPSYPEALYRFIFQYLKNQDIAWDCGTGNGQVAQHLAKHFKQVYATDISAQQLEQAFHAPNIQYAVSAAEKTTFQDHQFDLITVGQALHWFKIDAFYSEVNRTLKPGGLIAIWGYALLTVNDPIDRLFLDFYHNIVGPYWDQARRLVENEYRDIPFPFASIATPPFYIEVTWSLRQFAGYLTSWSATQKFIKAHGVNPVEAFIPRVMKHWNPDEQKQIKFPVFLKLGTNL